MISYLKISKPIALVLFMAVILSLTGCKPSVSGQTDDWKANIEHVDHLVSEMPQFATPLEAVKTKAQAAWAEAEKLTDEDKKAEAMKSANDIIDKGFAGQLYKMQGLIDEIASLRKKLAGKTMSKSLIAKLNDAVDPANEAVENAQSAMSAGAETEAQANAIIGPAYQKLKASRDKWSSLKASYDKEQKANKKKRKKK